MGEYMFERGVSLKESLELSIGGRYGVDFVPRV